LQISAVLKDLPIRILTSSYNERKEIIHGIISIIDLPDITESIIKGVSKLLPSTLHSYRDQKSQGLVKSLIQSLLKHHPLWTSQHLSQAILNFASTYKSTNATNSVAKCLYAPLSWSFIILKSLDVSNEVNKGSFENLVKAQSILVAHVVASTNPKVLDSMFKSLCSMFQNSGKPSVLTEKYGEAILKFEQTSHTVILGSYFIKYLKAAKLEGDIAKYKTFLLDSFIKVTISTKVQPPIYLIQQSQHLLATVTQEAFKTLFLPAIQRSMLRNPEILLPVISYIIEQFVVDLSPYCLDLGKLLGANLYSKDDALRSAAVLTLRGLASRCSVGAEVEKLTKHLIGIFNGSEGKLTVPAYKMSVLEANLYSKDDALRSAAVLTLRGLASRCSVGAEVEKLTKHLIGIFNGSEGKLTVPAYKMSVLEGGSVVPSFPGEPRGADAKELKSFDGVERSGLSFVREPKPDLKKSEFPLFLKKSEVPLSLKKLEAPLLSLKKLEAPLLSLKKLEAVLSLKISEAPLLSLKKLEAPLSLKKSEVPLLPLKKLEAVPSLKKSEVPLSLNKLEAVLSLKKSEVPLSLNKLEAVLSLKKSEVPLFFDPNNIGQLASFYVSTGLADRNATVRKNMLTAALVTVDLHGKHTVSSLLPIFENLLDRAPKNSASYDSVRQSVVILMGSLARHLEPTDPRIKPIVKKLIEALSTPSQQIQERKSQENFRSGQYLNSAPPGRVAENPIDIWEPRSGVALALAQLVHLIDPNNIGQLHFPSRNNTINREGALLALQELVNMLGRVFEPYIVNVLPHLLLCFGDNSTYVRQAASDCAQIVMSKLSAHGVKLVLPSLLAALEEDSWRTKTGSVELLGAMAFCAPKQLSACLPSIVPKLITVLSDSHIKVQQVLAGLYMGRSDVALMVRQAALHVWKVVVSNTPRTLREILPTLFGLLLGCLASSSYDKRQVQRAYLDRSTETRKMAAQIIGNMYSLTDQKDLMPYLPTIIPGLKSSLLDPVPEVRSVSARVMAIKSRVVLPYLVPQLTQTPVNTKALRLFGTIWTNSVMAIKSRVVLPYLVPQLTQTPVNTKVMAIKSRVVLPYLVPQLTQTPVNTKALAILASVAGDALSKYLHKILPSLLAAMADDISPRDSEYCQAILPSLLAAMADDISPRDSEYCQAVILSVSDEAGVRAIMDQLLDATRSESIAQRRPAVVLLGAFCSQTKVDYSYYVPQLLRGLIFLLTDQVLSSHLSCDKTTLVLNAVRGCGYLFKHILSTGEPLPGPLLTSFTRGITPVLPVFREAILNGEPDVKEAAALGLGEVISCTSPDVLQSSVVNITGPLIRILGDRFNWNIKAAVLQTLALLLSKVGIMLKQFLPQLQTTFLKALYDQNRILQTTFLKALYDQNRIVRLRAAHALSHLIPMHNKVAARTLGDLVRKLGERVLPEIIPILERGLDSPEPEKRQGVCVGLSEIMTSTSRDMVLTFVNSLVPTVRKALCDPLPEVRQAAAKTFDSLHSTVGVRALDDILPNMLTQLNNPDPEISERTLDGLRQPGFCLPKGITPVLPVFREAILNGEPDVKEAAALGLGEVISCTSPDVLQSSVVNITGPLIRILGDRFNWNIKAAVLQTLALLLSKVGIMLKQFLPQLQTTFLKALYDQNRIVRLRAAHALSHLIPMHNKADAIYTELVNGIKSNEDPGTRETMLQALRGVIGDKMSDPVRKSMYMMLREMLSGEEDGIRTCVAGCLGKLIRYLSPEQLNRILNDEILADDSSISDAHRHGRSTALYVALKESPSAVWSDLFSAKISKVLSSHLSCDKTTLVLNAVRGCGYLFKHILSTGEPLPGPLLTSFTRAMNHPNNDVKQLLAKMCTWIAKSGVPLAPEFLRVVIPMLVNGTKEKNGYVKANSEYALVAVLRLRSSDATTVQNECLNLLDVGAKEALSDVILLIARQA
ncbi:eIF-2-alpha kinase activator GCN1, partial [Diaphorina citri]|uniref:EIF-2-alpha kinase activator GCN1 n=1 Tax=Diaphorina citri TaxID=121845 RepID=A0A3Q0J2A2_DIACI